MIHHITIITLHHPSPTYSGIDQQEAFPTMYILMLVAVLTLTKIIEIPTLSPRKFAPLAYFDKYICRRLVASQAVLLARVLLVSMAVGGEVVWGFTGISFVPILPRPFQFRVNPPLLFPSHPLYRAPCLTPQQKPTIQKSHLTKVSIYTSRHVLDFSLVNENFFSIINQNTKTLKLRKMTTLNTITFIVI